MASSKAQVLARERKWAAPVAGTIALAIVLLIAATLANTVSGSGSAEILRSTAEHKSSVVLTGIMQAIGFALLAVPIYFLFRAASARAPRVRRQFVGLVIAAPLFLALSAALTIGVRNDAADQFVAGNAKSTLSPAEAKEKCTSQQEDEGAQDFAKEFEASSAADAISACEKEKTENEQAENATREASLAPITSILGFAGGLGMIAALVYTCLWALRTGLLTKFWGALGMGAGVALLLGPLFVVSLLWFIYLALLLIGRVPGGKPPAWAAGEAVAWPTPGEKAAKGLEPDPDSEPEPEPGGEAHELEAGPDVGEPVQAPEPPELPEAPEGPGNGAGGQKRKRKRRD